CYFFKKRSQRSLGRCLWCLCRQYFGSHEKKIKIRMTKTLHIKNMVCNRCKSTVVREIKAAGFELETIELGKVTISGNDSDGMKKLLTALNNHGFEIIKDDTEELIEKLKITLIQKLESQELSNLSEFLPNAFHKSYSAWSKLFSKTEGM